MAKARNTALVVATLVAVVGLIAGIWYAVWWVNALPGQSVFSIRDPDDYMGKVPPLTKLESYPRLVPWDLKSKVDADTTVFKLHAVADACNLSKENPGQQATETLHRVDIRETAETVTIETWLGPPETEGFWPGCKGTGFGFPVWVELERPLGTRSFVDPACDLDHEVPFVVCDPDSTRGKLKWR